MLVRRAESTDRRGIRDVARSSFRSSYSLSPQRIDTLIEGEFSDAALTDRIDDTDVTFLVAEPEDDEDDGIVGFVEGEENGGEAVTIRWLHVTPDARGRGIGTELVESVRDGGDREITARVLEDAVEGREFLERFGLAPCGTDRREIGGAEYEETVFRTGTTGGGSNEPSVDVPGTVRVDGRSRALDRDERIPGRDAPFFPVYVDGAHEEQYGYFCSRCGGTDVVVDGLDRLECGDCGNVHRPDEWDGAYL